MYEAIHPLHTLHANNQKSTMRKKQQGINLTIEKRDTETESAGQHLQQIVIIIIIKEKNTRLSDPEDILVKGTTYIYIYK